MPHVNDQGPPFAVFLASVLGHVTADQRRRLHVYRQRVEPAPRDQVERLFQFGPMAGKDDHLPQKCVPLPHVGRLDEADFRLLHAEGDAARRFLSDVTVEFRPFGFGNANVVQHELLVAQAQDHIAADELSLGQAALDDFRHLVGLLLRGSPRGELPPPGRDQLLAVGGELHHFHGSRAEIDSDRAGAAQFQELKHRWPRG